MQAMALVKYYQGRTKDPEVLTRLMECEAVLRLNLAKIDQQEGDDKRARAHLELVRAQLPSRSDTRASKHANHTHCRLFRSHISPRTSS